MLGAGRLATGADSVYSMSSVSPGDPVVVGPEILKLDVWIMLKG